MHIVAVEHTTRGDAKQYGKPTNYVRQLFSHLKDKQLGAVGVEVLADQPIHSLERENPMLRYWRAVYRRALIACVHLVPLEEPDVQALHSFSDIVGAAIEQKAFDDRKWQFFAATIVLGIGVGAVHFNQYPVMPSLFRELHRVLGPMTREKLLRLDAALCYYRSLRMERKAKAANLDGIVVGALHGKDIAERNHIDWKNIKVISDRPKVHDAQIHAQLHDFRKESYKLLSHVLEALVKAAQSAKP